MAITILGIQGSISRPLLPLSIFNTSYSQGLPTRPQTIPPLANLPLAKLPHFHINRVARATHPMTNSSSNRASDDATDVSLMAKIAQGDHAAFDELVSRHQYAVVGTVAKMLGNPSEAEDIAQQVFLRLWKSAPRYKPTAKFTTYLFTITRNLVFNETRRKSRRSEQSLDEQTEDWHQQFQEEEHNQPDEQILQMELQQAVDKAVRSLPDKQRMAVVLRRYENMSYEEIADVLGISVSAVKSQLFRARSSLRESLKSFLGPREDD